jgi:hypothetical protein
LAQESTLGNQKLDLRNPKEIRNPNAPIEHFQLNSLPGQRSSNNSAANVRSDPTRAEPRHPGQKAHFGLTNRLKTLERAFQNPLRFNDL